MNRSSSRESFPALPTTAHREWREALAAGTDDAMREETKEAGDAGKPVAKDEPLIGIAATPGLFKVSDAPAGARDVEPVPGLSATPGIFKPSVPIHVIEAEERARGAVAKTPPRSPAPPGEAPTTPARRSLFRSFKRSARGGEGEAEPRARSKSTPPLRSPPSPAMRGGRRLAAGLRVGHLLPLAIVAPQVELAGSRLEVDPGLEVVVPPRVLAAPHCLVLQLP